MSDSSSKLLKKDTFGEIRRVEVDGELIIIRDATGASRWARALARRLLRSEANALAALDGIDGVPDLIDADRDTLRRHFVNGEPLYRAAPPGPEYFRAAARLLRRLHAADVVHNDLAKEPNLLVCSDGSPAFIDYQLAWHSRRRGRLFRILGREDLRHLLKHKRSYCPDALTRRERQILDTPSLLTRIWRATVKPVYLFVTRRILHWSDREGAGDRGVL